MDKIEKQREHFESISEKYYQSRQSRNHLLFKDLLWGYFLKSKNYFKKDQLKVLEPMCGYAEGKDILEKNLGVKVCYTGFDYSKNLVDKVKINNPKMNIFEMDVTKFVPESKFDLVIVIGGLHHVPFNVSEVLKIIYKSLNKGGYFICFEPTHNNYVFKKIRERIYRNNPFFDDATERAFELKNLNKCLKDNDFEIIDQIYPGLLSYILYYNPDAFPFLNEGNKFFVKLLFGIDKFFFRNILGKKFSFATITLAQKI